MEELIARVTLFAGNFAPKGFMFCDGTLLPIPQYTALFSLIGTIYGGDGRTTFALPNLDPLKDKSGAELNYIICIDGIFPSRP